MKTHPPTFQRTMPDRTAERACHAARIAFHPMRLISDKDNISLKQDALEFGNDADHRILSANGLDNRPLVECAAETAEFDKNIAEQSGNSITIISESAGWRLLSSCRSSSYRASGIAWSASCVCIISPRSSGA
jgi:hypothetical protein